MKSKETSIGSANDILFARLDVMTWSTIRMQISWEFRNIPMNSYESMSVRGSFTNNQTHGAIYDTIRAQVNKS